MRRNIRSWRVPFLGFALALSSMVSLAQSNALWSGSVQCQLNLQTDGYVHQEVQTWTLTGAAPTQQGAMQVFPATWSVIGQGGAQRPTLVAQWSNNVPAMSAPIAIFIRASDNRLLIKLWHTQLAAFGGVNAIRQISGTQSNTANTAYEWAFPAIEDVPTSTNVSGTGTVPVTGNSVAIPSASATGSASCHWHFIKGGNGPSQHPVAIALGANPSPTLRSQPTILGVATAANATSGAATSGAAGGSFNSGLAGVTTSYVGAASAVTVPSTSRNGVDAGITNVAQTPGSTTLKAIVTPVTAFRSAVPGMSSPLATAGIAGSQNSGSANSVAPTSNGPAAKQAPEGTGTTGYDAVNSTPASFQISLHGITNPPTGYGWDYKRTWCDATGCKMLALPGDTAQVDGQFQSTDEAHVIVGRSGADQTVGNPGVYDDYGNLSSGPFNGTFALPGGQANYIPTPAWIYVKRGSQHSNLVSFNYAPPMQQVWIGPAQFSLAPSVTTAGFGADVNTYQFPNPNDGTDYFGATMSPIRVEHRGGFLGGNKGDDMWFTASLTDGWYIVQFGIDCQGSQCSDDNGLGGGATLATPFVPGTINPIKVHWWVNAGGWSSYTVHPALMIGPQGTNPYRVN